jgi:hypothetical protein
VEVQFSILRGQPQTTDILSRPGTRDSGYHSSNGFHYRFHVLKTAVNVCYLRLLPWRYPPLPLPSSCSALRALDSWPSFSDAHSSKLVQLMPVRSLWRDGETTLDHDPSKTTRCDQIVRSGKPRSPNRSRFVQPEKVLGTGNAGGQSTNAKPRQ